MIHAHAPPVNPRMDVCFTIDYEPDCPPYMTDTFRGVEEGTGPQLDMLRRAGVTSSVLRLPRLLREAYLSALSGPVVLFVHPWEFVDLRHTNLRLDCRFNTGETALLRVRAVLRFFARRGARFLAMRELARPVTP